MLGVQDKNRVAEEKMGTSAIVKKVSLYTSAYPKNQNTYQFSHCATISVYRRFL